MKIVIFPSISRGDKTQLYAGGIVAVEGAKASRFRDTIKFFTHWIAVPAWAKAMGVDFFPVEIGVGPFLLEHVLAFNPDIIEVHSQEEVVLYLAHALPEIPIVYYMHNAEECRMHLTNLSRSIKFRHLAHTIVVSHFASVYANPKYISVIHNALPTSGWQTNFSQKEKIILFSGRIHAEKGIEQLLEALKRLSLDYPDWRIIILGLLPLYEQQKMTNYFEKQKSAFEQTLKDQCLWISSAPRETIKQWTKRAAISIVPSNYDENFPLVLLESHMASCAVISSGRGGMREVSGPEGALYLKEVSGKEIEEKLRYLIEHPAKREALAQRGYDYVIRHHNINDRAKELDDLRVKLVAQAKEERKTPRQWKRTIRRKQWSVVKTKIKQFFNQLT